MAVRRLGKGLGALIPDIHEDEVQSGRLRDVEVSRVKPNPFQPRELFDPTALKELKQSIEENGVIQPISVRETDDGYELVAGERRLRAAQDLGLDRIPAFILEVETDEEMLELSLIENIQRENLNPIDEAKGYQTLINKCSLTQEAVATKIGKDRATIANFLRLLKLPDVIQQSLIKGEISAGHARSFLALSEKSDQLSLWKETVRKKWSVRQVEQAVKHTTSPAKQKKEKREKSDPFILSVEDKIRSILGTQVRIHKKAKGPGGKIEVEYYSDTDLERILEMIESI